MKNKKLPIIIIGIVLVLVLIGVILFLVLGNRKVTITFNENGGIVLAPMEVKKGEPVNLPDAEKEGYSFEGWYLNEEKVPNPATFKENATLVAHYVEETAKTMTITFDTKGGNKIEPMTIECDPVLNLPKPTRTGYKFVTWLDKNEVPISNETKLVCGDLTLYAKWEKEAEKKSEAKPASEAKKEYTCPSGYTLNGTKCTMETAAKEKCPDDTKVDGTLCIRTSDSNAGNRVCKEDTVSIDGKGHTYTGKGDYYFFGNSYGKCAYYQWKSYTTQTQCEQAYDINHKTTWVNELSGCYAETKMGNYETVCSSDYQYYSSSDLSSKFGIHDNGKCLRKVSKVKYCDTDGYTLSNGKCVKTIDATLK